MNEIHENEKYRQSISAIAEGLPIQKGCILITGSTGMIGSCLTDVFAYANHANSCEFKIYALGRSIERLQKRFAYDACIIPITHDIMLPLPDIQFDYIIHAASNADPRSYALYPVETILTNIIGSKNVLQTAIVNRARVLLTSSFEVYGKLNQDTYSEEDFGLIDQNHLRSSYPESKRVAELLFRTYHDEYEADSVIARFSSVYGPTMLENDSKAHAQFLRNAINQQDIVLKSEGRQKRTYTYVMDAVSGLLTVLFKGKSGEAYNVANENCVTTISELAKTIAELAGTNVVMDLPDTIEKKGFSRPQNCVLNTKKIRKLGWSGCYGIRQGLDETLQILREL